VATAVVDPLLAGLAFLAAGQLKILKDNLQHLKQYAEEETVNLPHPTVPSEFKVMFEKIQQCVEHHNSILQ
jgi:hypothetical protein